MADEKITVTELLARHAAVIRLLGEMTAKCNQVTAVNQQLQRELAAANAELVLLRRATGLASIKNGLHYPQNTMET